MQPTMTKRATPKPKPPTHGGAREGAGRTAVDGAQPDTTYLIKLESAQKAKLLRLGGAAWIRGKIDKAREPGPK